jgi:hypothetical protein
MKATVLISAMLISLGAAAPAQSQPPGFTYVSIPTSNNIQTALISTVPTATFIANNALATPFGISEAPGKCGPSGASPCNFYDGFGGSGSGKSITMDVSIASPTDIYTLMNAYSPAPGAQLATIEFVGTGGTSISFPLIAGENIRDFAQGGFANTLTNGVAGVEALNAFSCVDPATCLGSGGTGNVNTGIHEGYVLDEQHFSLGTTFAGETLTQIILTDTHNGSVPLLLGVTAGSSGAQASATELKFIPVTPCRIADTRNATGAFGAPELAAQVTRTFNVPQSACGIPATAVAYSLNATVAPTQSLGYLTLWPTGGEQPVVSTLNSDGRVKANAAIVPAGANGGVSVYASDATQFILDIDGYFAPAGTASGLEFYPLTPCRVADTRNATGALGGPFLAANAARAFPVQSSACAIPSTAKAYSLNVTAVPHGSLGFLSAWPSGQTQPVVSTLNASTGAVTANAAIVPAGSGGDISILVSDDSDVILDVDGYFAPPATGGLSLYTMIPCRVLDTRSGSGNFNGTLTVGVHASFCAPPTTAQVYVLNATVVPESSLSYLTLWSAGGTQPVVSTLNAGDGAVTSNMAIVPTSNGSIDAFSTDPTNLILDISSFFAP